METVQYNYHDYVNQLKAFLTKERKCTFSLVILVHGVKEIVHGDEIIMIRLFSLA